MERRSLIVLTVAGLVMFAGCASLISSRDNGTPTTENVPQGTPTAEGTTAEGTTENAENTETTESSDESEETTTNGETTTTTTTTESWSQPEPPNTPLQDNIEEEGENSIKNIDVGGDGSSEEGYSSVELTITANSSMPDVDPEEHGDVRGEPFIVIYIDGHLVTSDDTNYATPRGFIATRTPELEYRENGEFVLSVPQEAFEAAGVEDGDEVELMVLLLDQDKDWDDIYGMEFVDVTYDADA